MNRRTILILVAVVAVLSAGLGWVGGQRIKSPAEIAADAEPPPASLITVPVEERELSTTVVIRGQVSFEDEAEIPVIPSADGATIVTNMPKTAGEQLQEGEVAVEVAGRPLFVLEGQLPVFRPLGPGVEGPDVRQLEEALVRLGFNPGTVDEIYDNGTEEAVAAMYRAAGYSPNEPTPTELDQLEQARQRERTATESLRTARNNANAGGVPESVRLQADQNVRQAELFLDEATRLRDAELAPLVEERTQAVSAQSEAQVAADLAASRLAAAQAGTHPDSGQPPTAEELTGLTTQSQEAAAVFAQSQVVAAVADKALGDAQREQNPPVEEAATNLAIAKASRTEQFAELTRDNGAADAVRASQQELTDARDSLNKLDSGIGTSFPSNELFFLPELPREVQRVLVKTGDTPQGAAMTVTGSGVVIRSSVSIADRPLLREGAEGIMEDPNLGVSLSVRVAFVADSPGGPDAGSDRYTVRLEPLDEVPEDAFNQNLRVTLPFESTGGAVLAVPLAALSAGADGTSRVQVERSEGVVETITVKTGLLARSLGLVEIEPVDAELAAGDRVVVGREAGSSAANAEESDSEPAEESDAEPAEGQDTEAEE